MKQPLRRRVAWWLLDRLPFRWGGMRVNNALSRWAWRNGREPRVVTAELWQSRDWSGGL